MVLAISVGVATCVTPEQQVQSVLLPFGIAEKEEEERIEEAAGSEQKDPSETEGRVTRRKTTTTIIETETIREKE